MIEISSKAQAMIEHALNPLIRKGCRIERLAMNVCPNSPIAQMDKVHTKYGSLRIEANNFLPLGKSYIIEDSWRKTRGFTWVSGYQQSR
ncbi:hypothetical protein P4H27_09905 [Paenibacillus taichungensis]|uniref:hypothetical protein n=1 Tax=Paenibacillus taichungensis TaxID=484184 RepID=UPI002DBAD906|nr:hypothetical protein [Paenibacillus taichungensis]MEC0107249.1 hypothetical protein [Paenibacillus taichungensis]MEC0194819.1 hypothetical protein [Paenibacillus taichungensis]